MLFIATRARKYMVKYMVSSRWGACVKAARSLIGVPKC